MLYHDDNVSFPNPEKNLYKSRLLLVRQCEETNTLKNQIHLRLTKYGFSTQFTFSDSWNMFHKFCQNSLDQNIYRNI